MEYRRAKGQGGASQAWIDKNLPICPLCKALSLWETATQVDELALGRWHFRCPNCKAVLSSPPDLTVSALSPPVTVVRKAVTKNIRIESVGRNDVDGLVGKEYPLAAVQRWAAEKKA